MAGRRVDVGQLITDRFPLRGFATALTTSTERRHGARKALITP